MKNIQNKNISAKQAYACFFIERRNKMKDEKQELVELTKEDLLAIEEAEDAETERDDDERGVE